MYRRSPNISFRHLPGQTVLFNSDSGAAVTVDETGSEIWQILVQPMALAAITEHLAAEYETTTDEIASDISNLIAELTSAGFVQRCKAPR